ncbi:MAG: hypothetical protein WDA27_15430 [Actinomycetota bacterium]
MGNADAAGRAVVAAVVDAEEIKVDEGNPAGNWRGDGFTLRGSPATRTANDINGKVLRSCGVRTRTIGEATVTLADDPGLAAREGKAKS